MIVLVTMTNDAVVGRRITQAKLKVLNSI